jgi:hypothetical protein
MLKYRQVYRQSMTWSLGIFAGDILQTDRSCVNPACTNIHLGRITKCKKKHTSLVFTRSSLPEI